MSTYVIVMEIWAALARPGLGGERHDTVMAAGFDTRERGLIVVEMPLWERALSPEIRAVGQAAGSISGSGLHLIATTSLDSWRACWLWPGAMQGVQSRFCRDARAETGLQ